MPQLNNYLTLLFRVEKNVNTKQEHKDKVPAGITCGRVCIIGGGCRAENAV